MILDRFAKLGGKEKAMIGLALLALFVLLVDFVVVRPLVGRISDVEKGVNAVAETLAYHRRVLAREKEVSGAYDGVHNQIGKISSSEEATVAMLGDVDEMAISMGVVLNRREPREPKELMFCEELAVNVGEFECEMSNLLLFLDALHKSPGMLRVTELSISPQKGQTALKGSMVITKVMAPVVPEEG